MPEVREVMARDAITPKPGNADELARWLAFDVNRWTSLARGAGIKAE
jgi:tripartite-type tricarboxylate transporter receptor subunit TctC